LKKSILNEGYMSFDITSYLKEHATWFEEKVKEKWFDDPETDPSSLYKAMQYSFFSSGKRVRPALCFATAEALGVSRDHVLPIAASLEMIHVFSLIHDDLPAMDDDDLRRGQPTNHKVFGEAVAILAGDALLSEAFMPLLDIDREVFSSDSILEVVRVVMTATGPKGMIGGQVIDLESEGESVPLERLQKLHAYKTGALIRAAVLAVAVLAEAKPETVQSLDRFATGIGLAFQIADDILDVEGGAEIGKDVGSDLEKGKSTYVSHFGLDGAKEERQKAFEEAVKALDSFGEGANALRALGEFIVNRKK
jgi:geranylgeranyl diphosphate synthase type II